MKRFQLAGWVAILMCAPHAFAQTKAAPASSAATIEEIKKFDHDWLDAEKRLDIAYCEKYFADSYVLVFPNGQSYTKAEWLGILKGPDHPTIEYLVPENIQVHLHGNIAVITDHTTLKGHDSKGNSMDGVFNVFRVVTKQDGVWKATGVVMNAITGK